MEVGLKTWSYCTRTIEKIICQVQMFLFVYLKRVLDNNNVMSNSDKSIQVKPSLDLRCYSSQHFLNLAILFQWTNGTLFLGIDMDKPGKQWQYYTHTMSGHSFDPNRQKHLLHHFSANWQQYITENQKYWFTKFKVSIPCKSSLLWNWASDSLQICNR